MLFTAFPQKQLLFRILAVLPLPTHTLFLPIYLCWRNLNRLIAPERSKVHTKHCAVCFQLFIGVDIFERYHHIEFRVGVHLGHGSSSNSS